MESPKLALPLELGPGVTLATFEEKRDFGVMVLQEAALALTDQTTAIEDAAPGDPGAARETRMRSLRLSKLIEELKKV